MDHAAISQQNPIARAQDEIMDFLSRFYHELGIYAVASALDVSIDEPHDATSALPPASLTTHPNDERQRLAA